MSGRYAIYFIPSADSPTYQRVSAWLGYSILQEQTLSQRELPADLHEFRGFTRHAALYGCHATLKPPFRLRAGLKEKHLLKIFKHFCRICRPIRCSGLRVDSIGRFLALTQSKNSKKLDELATDCVQTFDLFRDEISEAGFNKRQPEKLSPNQLKMLQQWGYPFVLDEFRFHITLSDPLPESSLSACKKALNNFLLPTFSDSFVIDSLSLCHQAHAGEPFRVLKTCTLKR
jgi:hypothetical protein